MVAPGQMRDRFLAEHEARTKEIALAIGDALKITGEQRQALGIAAVCHDIGMVHLSEELLCRRAPITRDEYVAIQKHPETGARMLGHIEFRWPIAEIIAQHHERMYGSGYPLGLTGNDIRLEARIIAVADVVEAMCSNRPYRTAPGLDAALREIQEYRGKLYDADVVDACVQAFEDETLRQKFQAV